MYQGEVSISEQDLQRFLTTSEDLCIMGLSEHNQENSQLQYFDKNVDTKNEKDVRYSYNICDKSSNNVKEFSLNNKNQLHQIVEQKISTFVENIEY